MARLSGLPARAAIASRQGRFLALLVVLVLALHAAVLVVLAPSWIDPAEPAMAPPTLSVRSVVLPVTVPESTSAAPRPATAPSPAAPKLARVAPPRPPAASAPLSGLAPPALEAVASQPTSMPSAAEIASDEQASPTVAAAPTPMPAPATVIDVPVYPTSLPAAGAWRYRLQRGIAGGEAQLSWQPDGQGRYTLRLEGWIAGLTVLDWASSGALDSAGIAPERFAIRRRGKDSQAANFQRDAGKITFSGPTHEVPLVAGAQDRLSWMVQLPAIVQAAPERFVAGSSVVLMVVGARGGADVWTFDVTGVDRVGDVPALKLARPARQPRDLNVEVWLDPARGHLPLRALLTQAEGGAPLELMLQPSSTGP